MLPKWFSISNLQPCAYNDRCYWYDFRVVIVFGNPVHVTAAVTEVTFDLVVLLTCNPVYITIDVTDMMLE